MKRQVIMITRISAMVVAFGTLIAGTAMAQPCTFRMIASRADSVLQAYIGDSLFAHCTRTGTISYMSRNEFGVLRSGFLAGSDTLITDVLVHAAISYTFSMRYALCPDLDTIHGELEIVLVGPAMSPRPPDIRFIPEMVLSNLPCHFIRRENALNIASKEKGMAGKPLQARLFYDPRGKRYIWEVEPTTSRSNDNSLPVSVMVSAANGEVINENGVGMPETSINHRGDK